MVQAQPAEQLTVTVSSQSVVTETVPVAGMVLGVPATTLVRVPLNPPDESMVADGPLLLGQIRELIDGG